MFALFLGIFGGQTGDSTEVATAMLAALSAASVCVAIIAMVMASRDVTTGHPHPRPVTSRRGEPDQPCAEARRGPFQWASTQPLSESGIPVPRPHRYIKVVSQLLPCESGILLKFPGPVATRSWA
jgi:hypothetical protein